MNKYAYEYMENIQENYSFILNNFNLILFFAKSVTNNIDSNTHFWLFKNDNLQYKNTNLKTCVHPPVHCSIIYNSQNMEAA